VAAEHVEAIAHESPHLTAPQVLDRLREAAARALAEYRRLIGLEPPSSL
jgi:hypothetical protein